MNPNEIVGCARRCGGLALDAARRKPERAAATLEQRVPTNAFQSPDENPSRHQPPSTFLNQNELRFHARPWLFQSPRFPREARWAFPPATSASGQVALLAVVWLAPTKLCFALQNAALPSPSRHAEWSRAPRRLELTAEDNAAREDGGSAPRAPAVRSPPKIPENYPGRTAGSDCKKTRTAHAD